VVILNVFMSEAFWQEAFYGSLSLVWTVVKVVIPIMILLEIVKDLKWLDKISEFLAPTVRIFGISKEGALPLVVGMVIGIAYGAAVIIHAAKEGKLTTRELQLIILFLVINHSVIEDNFLFYSVGANFWALFFVRLFAAILVTFIASKFLKDTSAQDPINLTEEIEKKDRCC